MFEDGIAKVFGRWAVLALEDDNGSGSGGAKESGDGSKPEGEGNPPAGDSDSKKSKDSAPKEGDPLYSKAEVERIVAERLDRQKKTEAAEREKADRLAREKALKEAGDWEKVAESRAGEVAERDRKIAELEADLAKRDRDVLVSQVIIEHKLPADAKNRLLGDTLDELKADAKKLAKLIAAPESPDLENGAKRPKGNGDKAEQIRRDQSKNKRYASF